MSAKRFMFVSGDIGGANYQLPVARELTVRGYWVKIVVDGEGMAQDVFLKNKISHTALFDFDKDDINDFIYGWNADLIFVNTCASATYVELDIVRRWSYDNNAQRPPLVLGADGFFNHGFRKWQDAQADY